MLSALYRMQIFRSIDCDVKFNFSGLIVSAQCAAYAMSKFVAGILSDRIRSSVLLVIGLIGVALSLTLFAVSSTPITFVICWFVNGLFQGAGWPAAIKFIHQVK